MSREDFATAEVEFLPSDKPAAETPLEPAIPVIAVGVGAVLGLCMIPDAGKKEIAGSSFVSSHRLSIEQILIQSSLFHSRTIKIVFLTMESRLRASPRHGGQGCIFLI